ncbi:MAG: hypothetical protein KatS3mg129_2692 [Leptospiraceae bacterium]|nr:MAG: hypothetical protein KatS3mg129_2692 [Leptospiraceae bacterium]
MLFLKEKKYYPYWFETGTPAFLIRLLAEKKFFLPNLEELVATDQLIGNLDIDFIEPENLLFQTGYLTIKKYEAISNGYLYYLGYPNKEVKISLNQYILNYLMSVSQESLRLQSRLYKILSSGEIKELEEILKSLFNSIPYDWYRKNELSGYEGYYASVIYSFLAGAGLDLIAEDHTNQGRIDLSIFYIDKCYIMEFKVVELAGGSNPIEQIKTKKYYEKYQKKYPYIYLIGIEFSKQEKNLIKFEWEKI